MKRLVLMIIPALICGAVFTGCDSNEEEPEKTTGELYVIGAKSATVKASDKTDLVFTGDDLVSFNARYGEIVFTESKFSEILSRLSHHTELHFFIGDKPVFDPPIRIHYGWGLSDDDFDLQFRTDGIRTFLTGGYMYADTMMTQVEREIKELEMKAIREKRQKELDVLIKFLSDAGKITEHVSPIPKEPENSQSVDGNYVIVSDSLFLSAPDFPVSIIDMKIESNCLKIKFSAGGCDGSSWYVQLIDSGVIAESIPPQRSLRLSIDSKELCSALVTKEMSFNIEDLQVKGESRVQLNISGKSILYEY